MFKKINYVFAVCAIVVGVQAPSAHAQSIVDIASGDENFSALTEAVVSQGLAETLAGEGTFTVFAPTNDAFAALPSFVASEIEKNPDLLTDILLYHVAGEELMSGDVLATDTITTLQGGAMHVSANDDGAFVNSSMITAVDIDADNGVVHVVDRVLLPRSVYDAVLESMLEQLAEIRSLMTNVR